MRLFFACWPPRAAAAALARWAGRAARDSGGRAAREDSIHLTLAFLGEVPDPRLDAALGAARSTAATRFDLPIEQAVYWPHNHIVWAGPGEVPAALLALAAALRTALEAAGFALERRAFAAHVTLIRKARATAMPALPEVRWPVEEFVLVRSTPRQGGSRYEIAARFPLAA